MPVERDLDTRMPKQFAEALDINAALDALRCECVPQSVKTAIWHVYALQKRPVSLGVSSRLSGLWRTGQKENLVRTELFEHRDFT